MSVCAAGHIINAQTRKYPEKSTPFCDKCGERAVNACADCNTPIPGLGGFPGGSRIPNYCKKCGKPFPWKEKKDAIADAVALAKYGLAEVGPEAAPAQARPAIEPKPIVDEIADFLRAVPRGIRELSAEHRRESRPPFPIADEYDLQDFVRAFLMMRYPRATLTEEPVPTVANKGGRVDFVLDDLKCMVELKVFRSEADWNKTMFPDLSSKIERYGKDDRCDVLYILVYDPNHAFRGAVKAEHDLTSERTIGEKRFRVHLIVTPQA